MNKKHLFKTLFLFTALACPAFTYASTNTTNESDANVNNVAVNEELSEQQTDAILKSLLKRMPKFSGYLQTGYNYASAGKGTSSFQAKRLRLLMDGNLAPRFSVRLQLELFNGIFNSTNGNGQKNIQVMDAFVTAKVSDGLKFRAGQYYLPIGYENYDISPATLETVDFSNICYRIVCRNPIGYNFVDYGRDLGVMALGDLFYNEDGGFHYVSYNLSLTNGHLPMKDDNNKSKDFVASLTLRPIKYMNIKGSYNWGEYRGTVGEASYNYQPMSRYIIGAWYNNPNGLDLRAEYGVASSDDDDNDVINEKGFYALAAWHAGKFLPVVRYDMYKDKVNEATLNNYDRYLIGLTYAPNKYVKFQANFGHFVYNKDARVSNDGDKSSNQFQLMGVFSF